MKELFKRWWPAVHEAACNLFAAFIMLALAVHILGVALHIFAAN